MLDSKVWIPQLLFLNSILTFLLILMLSLRNISMNSNHLVDFNVYLIKILMKF